MQTRARDYLDRIEAELDAKRRELGVEDALKEVPGVTTAMLVALGENGVKTVEDLAGCATDDLAGWTERKDGETKREPGFLDGFELSPRGGRGDHHAGPPQGRLDHRSRSRATRNRRGAEPKRPSPRRERGTAILRPACWRIADDTDTRHAGRARARRGDGAAVRRRRATVKPVDELIRFVVAPGRRGGPGPQAQAAGPRRLGHGDARRRRRRRSSASVFAAASSASVTVAADLGASGRAPAGARGARCPGIAHKAGGVVTGFAKVEAALAGGKPVGAPARPRRRRGRRLRKLAAAADGAGTTIEKRRNPGRRGVYVGAIGFGIGAVKCGTCCPARRPSEQRASSRAASASSASGRTIRADVARNSARLNARVRTWTPVVTDWDDGMTTDDTKTPGDKTLSVSSTKTLTLKPRAETGVVRQSFSHGRTKAVVVEKVKRRVGPGEKAGSARAGRAARDRGTAARRGGVAPRSAAPARRSGRPRRRPRRRSRPAWCCAR